MNKTLKKFAIAIMVAGATVTATRAPAAAVTDTQVLHNVEVTLSVYSQGTNASSKKSLAVTDTKFTTTDLIQQLSAFDGLTFAKTQKLVTSTTYGFLAYVPGTSVTNTNGLPTTTEALNPGTNLSIVDGGTIVLGTNYATGLVFDTTTGSAATLAITGTNAYLITNNAVWKITVSGTGTYTATNTTFDTITNGFILTNGASGGASTTYGTVATVNAEGTFTGGYTNTNSSANVLYGLGVWTLITSSPTLLLGGTANATVSNFVTITQFSPSNAISTAYPDGILTNVTSPVLCVYVPKAGATAPSLVAVTNWLALNNDSSKIYKETGANLSGTNFSGTNITTATAYYLSDLQIYTVWPTNAAAPTFQTNLSLDPYGIATSVYDLKNLVTGGTKSNAQVFQMLTTETIDVAGSGFIGGSVAAGANTTFTNTFNGASNVLSDKEVFSINNGVGNYIGTNFVSENYDTAVTTAYAPYIQFFTNVIYAGTIQRTYLTALPAADAITVSLP